VLGDTNCRFERPKRKETTMKLVIEHSETKRTIDGAFSICGSRGDLSALVVQLQARLDDDSWSYGWVTVYPALQQKSNTAPKGWDA
jgi:hypothetical protein